MTTQRRARCFSPEERNNVFDKRGPFRFHIPEDRPTNQESFITPVSLSLSPTYFPHACRYWGESQEWCISSRAGRLQAPTYRLPVCLSRLGVRSHVRELLPNACIFMACKLQCIRVVSASNEDNFILDRFHFYWFFSNPFTPPNHQKANLGCKSTLTTGLMMGCKIPLEIL